MTTREQRTGIALAVPADDKKIANLGEKFLIQPKLNGERCRVEEFHGQPVLLSSYGNEIKFCDHIIHAITDIWSTTRRNILFDGEIYKHGWERERIDSALRRKVNRSDETYLLEYHIFDHVIDISQGRRISELVILFYYSTIPTCLQMVPTYLASKTTWQDAAECFISKGYEGLIFRNPNFPKYDPRRLVNQMLKYKPTEEDEYPIIGTNEAIDKNGVPKNTLGSFVVKGDNGPEFSVGAGKLTHVERDKLWRERDSLVGKILVIRQGIIRTTNNIPVCAAAVRVRGKVNE